MKPARLLPGDTRWHARAACRDAPDGLFDPPDGSTNGHQRQRELRAQRAHASTYCTRCPVLDDCLLYAQEHDVWGIWAGQWWPDGRRV